MGVATWKQDDDPRTRGVAMPGVLTPHLMVQCTAQPSTIQVSESDYTERHVRSVDGTTMSYYLSATKLETWQIAYKVLPDPQYDSVIGFIDARKGGYETFYIDLPDGRTDIPVKIVPKTLRHAFDTAVTRSISFTVYRVK